MQEIKVNELNSEIIVRDSEILRLETEIADLKNQLSYKETSKRSRLTQTEDQPNNPPVIPEQEYQQRIADLEAKLIESDSRNLQLDSIVRNLYKTIKNLEGEQTKPEPLSPVKLVNYQQRASKSLKPASPMPLRSLNSAGLIKKQRKQASSFAE